MYELSNITTSAGFFTWMHRYRVSLILSCNATGELVFVGSTNSGEPQFHLMQFSRAMGLAAKDDRLFVADRTQLWCLRDVLYELETDDRESDRVYQPVWTAVTGDLDTHEVQLAASGQVIFTNTAFSCLARISSTHAFAPLWKPKFVSQLAGEDRCHLNGIGMCNGKPAVVSVFSTTDSPKGWRNLRRDGGAVIEVATDRILAEGLSMPHSPRMHEGALWVLDSGSGYLRRTDLQSGLSEQVVFAPGFLRGLTFFGHFALMTLSLPQASRIDGLALNENIARHYATPWSGLAIADIQHGCIQEWLSLGDSIPQLFDVAVLPNVRHPTGVCADSADFHRVFSDLRSQESFVDKHSG